MDIWTIISIISSLLGIFSFIKNDSFLILLLKKASFESVAKLCRMFVSLTQGNILKFRPIQLTRY